MKLRDASLVVICGLVCMILTGHLVMRSVCNYPTLEPQKRVREAKMRQEQDKDKELQKYVDESSKTTP